MAPRSIERIVTAFTRKSYRFAYLSLRLWWFVRRPSTRGAAVALWHDHKLLLVRTSYRDCYSLPGGFARRGEPSEEAARRELQEELGIALPAGLLRHAWHGTIPFESRQDTVDVWEATIDSLPSLHVAGREIVWAGWMAPAEVLERRLLPHLELYLRDVASK
jgi:8-oxo-dGTP pyrophosphatase MutT (NUDIX family)